MKLTIAVLLLSCRGTDRATTLTRDWVVRAMAEVARFVRDQSGGRRSVEVSVLDWFELPYTSDEWLELGFGAGDEVVPLVEQAHGVALGGFDQVVLVIDLPDANWAAHAGRYIHAAARHFTPALVCHELGHVFGAGDAFLDTADGPQRYANLFCVMGGEGAKHSFAHDALTLPLGDDGTNHGWCGPGMTVPTLLATGWLSVSEGAHGHRLSAHPTHGVSFTLGALQGAPGVERQGPPVFAWIVDGREWLLIEYRVREGWDRGMPDPGGGAQGWLVMHRTHEAPSLENLQVGAIGAAPGVTFAFGAESVFDIFNPGPLRLTVLSIDAGRGTVTLSLTRRAAKQLPQGTVYGGVDVGGGGLLWTPGGGLVPIAPDSPLLPVLERLSEMQGLQSVLSAGESAEEGRMARVVLEQRLRDLQGMVDRLPLEGPPG